MAQRTMELRHLPTNKMHEISLILDECDSWKRLMCIVPKTFNALQCSESGAVDWENLTNEVGLKYTNEHIRQISTPRYGDSRLCAEIFLDEWSTSGKRENRPTIGVLFELLVKAELFAAADYVAENILNESPPARPLNGPGAEIPFEIPSDILNEVVSFVNESALYPNTEDINLNAKISNGLSENNQDYFTKYRPEKNFNVNESEAPTAAPRTKRINKQEPSANIQSSSETLTSTPPSTKSTVLNGSVNVEPEIMTATVNGLSETAEEIPTPLLPLASMLLSNTKDGDVGTNTNTEMIESSAPLPLLSAFGEALKTTDSIMTDTDELRLPAISALNLNGQHDSEHENDESHQNGEQLDNDNSIDEDDENCENSLKNLENSNNDSSLTNVTGTSGENSFEFSSSSTSNENIPLNVLQYNSNPR